MGSVSPPQESVHARQHVRTSLPKDDTGSAGPWAT